MRSQEGFASSTSYCLDARVNRVTFHDVESHPAPLRFLVGSPRCLQLVTCVGDRLTSYSRAGILNPMVFQSQSWNYDDSGNWNSVTTDGEAQTRAHNASDQTTAIDGEALTTSLRGNLTQYTDPTGRLAGERIELTFCRHGNRLEEARVDGERIEYKYDAFDSRPARPRFTLGAPPRLRTHHCSSYGFASAHPIASVDRRESHANPSLSENEIQYYHRQAGVRLSGASEPQHRQAKKTPARQSSQHHVYAVSDQDGNIVEQYRYSAFGQVEVYSPTAQYLGNSFTNSAIGNTIGWNTKREDAVTGLLMYKYRDYSVSLGRWTQRDPIEESGGVNLYRFVGNGVLSLWDKLGMKMVPTNWGAKDTLANIYKKYRAFAYTGAAEGEPRIAKETNPIGNYEFKTKKENGLCCSKLVKAPILEVKITKVLPNDLLNNHIPLIMNGVEILLIANQNGFNALKAHENRRAIAYDHLDKKYLNPAEGSGAKITSCGWICRDTHDAAEKELLKFADSLQEEASDLYRDEIVPIQKRISQEKDDTRVVQINANINGVIRNIPEVTLVGMLNIANMEKWKQGLPDVQWKTDCPQ